MNLNIESSKDDTLVSKEKQRSEGSGPVSKYELPRTPRPPLGHKPKTTPK